MTYRFYLLLFALFTVVDLASAQSRPPINAVDLAGIRDIGGHHYGAMSVSPNGDYVAFQLQTPDFEQRNYTLTWYVAETEPGGDFWPVGDGGELILNPSLRSTTNGNRPPVAPLWSPDGRWIYYLKRSDKQIQIWRSRRDGSAQEQLTQTRWVLSAAASVETPPSFKFAKGGEALFFNVVGDTAAIALDLKVEGDRGFLFDDRFRPARKNAPFVRVCGFSAGGRPDEIRIAGHCKPQLWVYDIAKSSARKATPDEIVAYYSQTNVCPPALADRDVRLFRQSNDGSSALWLENEHPKEFPGFRAPVRLFASLDGEQFRCGVKICEAYGGVIEGVWFRSESNEIIFQRADGLNMSMTGLYAWKPGSDEVRIILQTEDKLADCEILEHRAICLREQWTHPRTIISLDLDSGEMQTIYDPNPEFNEIKFSATEKIEWKDKFGAATHGHLVYPLDYEKGRRYPLVITTYRSRGFLRGGIGDEYPIHLLAANGFMVLSHDMPQSFERFARMDNPSRAQFKDLHERYSCLSAQERVLDILAQRGLIDLRRTAITGLSNGGDQVRFALIHSDSFTTGIASSAFDYRAHYFLSNRNWRAFWEQSFGSSPDKDEAGYWSALSLGRNVHSVDAPLLVNVSDHELLLSVENFSRLQEAGLPIEMYVFPGEYHIKWQPQHRLAIYRRNVQWLKFWLMGEEEDDPVSPGQYARWREMRETQCERLNGDDTPWYCENGEVNVAAQ